MSGGIDYSKWDNLPDENNEDDHNLNEDSGGGKKNKPSNNTAEGVATYPVPPPRPECELCSHTLPIHSQEIVPCSYCGMKVCYGCTIQNTIGAYKLKLEYRLPRLQPEEFFPCAYCRQRRVYGEENFARWEKRMEENNDTTAMCQLATSKYRTGVHKNPKMEVKLLRKATDLGEPTAPYELAIHYHKGFPEAGIEVDNAKATEYLEIAAYRRANVLAWFNLGNLYLQEKNIEAAMYHFRMAAAYGFKPALKAATEGYKAGVVTKDDFGTALRAWQKAENDINSEARKEAMRFFPLERFMGCKPYQDV